MMLVSRSNPFAEIEKMQQQFDKIFTEMTTTQTASHWTPAVELQEKSDHFILQAIIPDLDRETLDIQVSKKAIVLSGKTQRPQLSEGEKYLYSEFPVGEFRRLVTLPEAVINTEVKADYLNGILVITLPKAPEVINRVVKVNLMETADVQ